MWLSICRWMRCAFPRYFSVKDAGKLKSSDVSIRRADDERRKSAEGLSAALNDLRWSLDHPSREDRRGE